MRKTQEEGPGFGLGARLAKPLGRPLAPRPLATPPLAVPGYRGAKLNQANFARGA